MKRFLKINLCIFIFSLLLISFINVNAGTKTGHKEFTKITFLYNDEAYLLIEMSNTQLDEMMKKVKRKAFGWSTYTNIINNEVVYEAGSIFSRSNNTSQPIDFTYSTVASTSKQLTSNLSGTLAMKASGKIDAVSLGLDTSIRGEIGTKNTISLEEEVDFSVKIMPNKKVSLLVKGIATLSNGASKYYFLGICTKKNYWEYIDVMSEYYELYEETIAY